MSSPPRVRLEGGTLSAQPCRADPGPVLSGVLLPNEHNHSWRWHSPPDMKNRGILNLSIKLVLGGKAEPAYSQLSVWCGGRAKPQVPLQHWEGSAVPQQCWKGHTGCRRCFYQVPVGQDTHLHINAHTELAEAIGSPTLMHWGVSSPMLEAQGRCTSSTGTQNPCGRCSQGNAWLTAAPVPSSVGAVGFVRGSAPLGGAAGVVHSPHLFGVLHSLWRTDCCRRAQVAAVITWCVCPSLHRSPQQWRCLRCPRGPSRTLLMGLPGPITLGT